MADEHVDPVVQARVEAIIEALKARAAGPPPKPPRRRKTSARADRLHDEGREGEAKEEEDKEKRAPSRYATSEEARAARPIEKEWRDTLAELLLAIEEEDFPNVTTDPAIGRLLHEAWDHLTHKDANGFSLCFDGPRRQDLLASMHGWLTQWYPELLERYASLWTPRQPPPNLDELLKPPAPKTPLPPSQQDLF